MESTLGGPDGLIPCILCIPISVFFVLGAKERRVDVIDRRRFLAPRALRSLRIGSAADDVAGGHSDQDRLGAVGFVPHPSQVGGDVPDAERPSAVPPRPIDDSLGVGVVEPSRHQPSRPFRVRLEVGPERDGRIDSPGGHVRDGIGAGSIRVGREVKHVEDQDEPAGEVEQLILGREVALVVPWGVDLIDMRVVPADPRGLGLG